jgi:hypothetical protein
MTVAIRAPEQNSPSHTLFRLMIMLFAVLLGMQCVWLLLAELSRPGVDGLPTDMSTAAAAAAAKQSDPAAWAAEIGAIRGDLWAESAFTSASLIFGDQGTSANSDPSQELNRAHASIDRALADAPHLSDAWLFLAGLADHYSSVGVDATETLKMSYYTGPSETGLIPLRLKIAAQAGNFDDIEMKQFASRDVRFLLTQNQSPALADAYNAASPAGKHFLDQAVGDIDPTALQKLKANGPQNSPLPN